MAACEFKVGIPAMSIVFLTAAVTTKTMTEARLFLLCLSVNVSSLLVGYGWNLDGGEGILVEKMEALSALFFVSTL